MSIKLLKDHIPNTWKIYKLQDLCNINPESLNVNKLKETDIIHYVDIASIDNKSFQISEQKKIKKKEIPSRARRLIEKDDVIVSTVRPYLKGFAKVRENKENFVCSTGFAVLRAKTKLNSEYLFQWITSDFFVNYMISRMVGSNYPAVNTRDVFKAPIVTPPLEEQDKIATVLGNVDEAIRTLQQLINVKQTFKRGLMQRIFSQGIGHSEFRESKLGLIPKEWEIANYDKIAEYINGYAFKPSDWKREGLPIIRIQNLTSDAEFNYFSGNIDDKYRVQMGDILFSWSATIGVFLWNREDAVLNQHIFKVIPKMNIDKSFLYYILQHFIENLKRKIHGTTMKHFRKNQLKLNFLPLPSSDEQKQIGKFLDLMNEEIFLLTRQLTQYKFLKKGLILQLLTGRIRVKVN